MIALLKTRRAQLLLLIALVVIGAAVLAARKLRQTRERKKAELAEINDRIDTGRGEGGADIKSLLANIRYADNAEQRRLFGPRVEQVVRAKGLVNDDEDAVFAALQASDVWGIKYIDRKLSERVGKDLDAWLDPRQGGFMSAGEYAQVVAIVRAKKLTATYK